MNPRYPIYVISKGRFNNCKTAKFLIKDKCPFYLVVEPQEYEEYKKRYNCNILVTPEDFSKRGQGSIPVRNFIWKHSSDNSFERHWCVDDNISGIYYRFKGKRFWCKSQPAFCSIEDFIDRYTNIGIGGMNYGMFVVDNRPMPPFYHNVHVYSCLCIMNKLPYRWRGRYNEDTDLCLQVLSGGYCTILTNIFSIDKMTTLTMKGGNMETLYKGDGRLKMARSLERKWPRVVTTKRRFQRPQHVIKSNWKYFDTPLKKKKGLKIEKKDYGLKLVQKNEVKSEYLKKLLRGDN